MIRPTRGFTLIEMLGVLAIMALLSAAASIMLGNSRHKADLQDAVEQFQQADSSARTLARSSGLPVVLSISLASGGLFRSSGITTTLLGTLPRDVKIQRVRIADTVTDYGSVKITFNARGCSASYAVRLSDSRGDEHWMMFAGMTGQLLKVNDADVDDIFQIVSSPAGPDAH